MQSPENTDKRSKSNLCERLDNTLIGKGETFLSKQSCFTSKIEIYLGPLFLIYPTHTPVC